ncbi:MAG: PspC domain-containing protein [Pseudomonadota bacterium]
MSTTSSMHERRFYRDADRAVLGGVCAGIAGYLGFNLCATRFLAVIAMFMTGPLFIVAYIAAVLLIPSASGREFPYEVSPGKASFGSDEHRESRRERRHRRRAERLRRKAERYEAYRENVAEAPEVAARAEVIRERCADLDERLRTLEKHVTSRKFQIEQELDRL